MKKPLVTFFASGLIFISCAGSAADKSTANDGKLPVCSDTLVPIMCTKRIDGDLVLDSQVMSCPDGIKISANLVLRNGSRIESGNIEVVGNGSITALGREDCPVILTSAEENPAAGDWHLHIHPAENVETSLVWTIIEYVGEPYREAIETTASDGSVAFDHVTIRKALGRTALDLRDGFVTKFSHVSFSEIKGTALEISPDESGIIESNILIDAESVAGPWVHVRGTRLDANVQWESLGIPYLIEDFSIRGTLRIDKGTEVLFDKRADLRVEKGGSLIVTGTETEPVIFSSVSDSPQPGSWDRIVIASSEKNRLSHGKIEYGGGNKRQGALTVTPSGAISVSDTVFADNLVCDIKNNGEMSTDNVTFTACP